MTFYGGEYPQLDLGRRSESNICRCVGALFGPAMTKWYQLLNRIQFPNATKATVYRVRLFNLISAVTLELKGYIIMQVALDQGVLTPGMWY